LRGPLVLSKKPKKTKRTMNRTDLAAPIKNPSVEEVKKEILEYCISSRTKDQILNFIQVEPKPYHFRKYISRLLEDRFLQHTIPHNPRAMTQQYQTTRKGLAYLRAISD
jgi:hypothetical protein